jgi:hypothetical protein
MSLLCINYSEFLDLTLFVIVAIESFLLSIGLKTFAQSLGLGLEIFGQKLGLDLETYTKSFGLALETFQRSR